MPKKSKAPTAPRPSMPLPARVEEDEDFRPMAITLDGKNVAVQSIDERMEEEDEWWSENPASKMHYRVTLEDGQTATIFRNMKTDSWYRIV